MMKSWKNWLLLALSLIFSVIVGEGLVRAFLGDRVVLFPRYHAEARYGDFTLRRLRPETTFWHTSIDGSWQFVVNRQGFRSRRDFTYAKSDDVLRIMVLGDSHTQGFEVNQDQTYAAVIERYLDRHGVKSEVMNVGISGFGTAEELVFLEQEAIRYDPDVVVLGFFANDFDDSVKADLFRLTDGNLTVQSRHHAPAVGILRLHNAIPPLRWLSENSYLYSLALNAAWETAKAALLSSKRGELRDDLTIATKAPKHYEQELVAQLVNRMYKWCRERSIIFIVVDIPQAAGPGDFETSIPDDLLGAFQASSDALIESEQVLSPYRGLAELHVPHGQNHISPFTHLMLGVEVADTARRLAAARHGDRLRDQATSEAPPVGMRRTSPR